MKRDPTKLAASLANAKEHLARGKLDDMLICLEFYDEARTGPCPSPEPFPGADRLFALLTLQRMQLDDHSTTDEEINK